MNANNDISELDFIEAPATMDSWELLMDYVADQSSCHLKDPKKSYGMRLAAEEILSNMIRETQDLILGGASIVIRVSRKVIESNSCVWFELTIADNGPPFDPGLDSKRDIQKNVPINQRPIGGIGLFLVQQSVDNASYCWHDNCNVYKLRARLPSA